MKKLKHLLILLIIYIFAYFIGMLSCLNIENIILKCFIFDTVATIVIFLFSVILKNSSVYDAYWSITPMIISLSLFIGNRSFSFWQIVFLIIFNIWSLRLTINWITVFTDFSYEDWRYTKFRNETPRILWPFINFFGIHYMPTVFVFLGMLPIFEIIKNPLGSFSILGMVVIIIGILLELFADFDMHLFLSKVEKATVCKTGLWRYSRHPNYLGEITVWLGVFLTMLPYNPGKWYYGIGFVVITIMFNTISIPLMEKRQLSRRPDYSKYKSETSRLLLLPLKKQTRKFNPLQR